MIPHGAQSEGAITIENPPTLDLVDKAADVLQLPATPLVCDLGPPMGGESPAVDFPLDKLPVQLIPVVLLVAQELGLGVAGPPDDLSMIMMAAEQVMESPLARGFGGWGVIPGRRGRAGGATRASP